MSITQIVEETKESLRKNIPEEKIFNAIIDRDYEEIERDTLGTSAMNLNINPETSSAIPQGNPFLRCAKNVNHILKRFKGIYSTY